jgi:DNA-directed RNA polymerase subunit H
MHILQPKHSKSKPEETAKLLEQYNISLTQLPKIKLKDPALPEGCELGDVIKIERKGEQGPVYFYRVIVE